jgi:hypothetical protein
MYNCHDALDQMAILMSTCQLDHIITCYRWLLVTASVVPSSLILITLMEEALSSSETSVLTRATWHNIPEDAILHAMQCCKSNSTWQNSLKCYEQMDMRFRTWEASASLNSLHNQENGIL